MRAYTAQRLAHRLEQLLYDTPCGLTMTELSERSGASLIATAVSLRDLIEIEGLAVSPSPVRDGRYVHTLYREGPMVFATDDEEDIDAA